jgi:hypothetical protein
MLKKSLIILSILLCSLPIQALELGFKTGADTNPSRVTSAGTVELIQTGGQSTDLGGYFTTNATAMAAAGLSSKDSLTVLCRNTDNTPWKLQIHSGNFVNITDNPGVMIALTNFKYNPVYAGVWDQVNSRQIAMSSNLVNCGVATAFSLTDATLYNSNSTDTNHDTLLNSLGTEIQLQLNVNVPADTPSGKYSNTITFTLTQ